MHRLGPAQRIVLEYVRDHAACSKSKTAQAIADIRGTALRTAWERIDSLVADGSLRYRYQSGRKYLQFTRRGEWRLTDTALSFEEWQRSNKIADAIKAQEEYPPL